MTNNKATHKKPSKPLFIVGIATLVLLITVAALLITNLVIKNKGADASVKAGTLISEKYGTFVIPEENMFVSSVTGFPLYFANGTDFTYFFDEFMSKLAKYRKVDVTTFKVENRMMLTHYADNLTEMILRKTGISNEDEYNTLINSEAYPFANSTTYYCPNHGNYLYIDLHNDKLIFDESKLAAAEEGAGVKNLTVMANEFAVVPKSLMDSWKISNMQNIDGDERDYCAESVKCLSKKVEMTVDGETSTVYIPVAIISDKGYPLTQSIYNEIMAEKAK